jgi:glutathione S-transferase
MLPLLLKLYVSRLADGSAPLASRIESEIANHLGYINSSLEGRDYVLGHELTAADIQLRLRGGVRAVFERWLRLSQPQRVGAAVRVSRP